MKINHDWLLGEDSALRHFLPPTFTARSPRAAAAPSGSSPCLAEGAAPIPGESDDAQ